MDRSQQLTKPMDLSEEELCGGIEDIDVEEGEPMTQLLKHIPPHKAITKVPKDPENVKFMVTTQKLLKKVVFEGTLLAYILTLKWRIGTYRITAISLSGCQPNTYTRYIMKNQRLCGWS